MNIPDELLLRTISAIEDILEWRFFEGNPRLEQLLDDLKEVRDHGDE